MFREGGWKKKGGGLGEIWGSKKGQEARGQGRKREGREEIARLGKAGWSKKKVKKLSIMRDKDLNRIKREGR